MAGLSLLFSLALLASGLSRASGAPTATAASTCNDQCASQVAAPGRFYAQVYICRPWFDSYPPAVTYYTQNQTQYEATVEPMTFKTRSETIYALRTADTSSPSSTLANAGLASSTAFSPATATATTSPPMLAAHYLPAVTQAPTTTSTSTPGLPLPGSAYASACSNDPAAFFSACSCNGASGTTHTIQTTTTIASTTTLPTATRECTQTSTAAACQATASYGLQQTYLQFGDSGDAAAQQSTLWSNSTSPGECCNACFTSAQSCRFFSYLNPTNGSHTLMDGGSCYLNLLGPACPQHQLPAAPSSPYEDNYITEGIFLDEAREMWSGFGSCAQQVPYFYGYQNGRAGVGQCTASTAVSTTRPTA